MSFLRNSVIVASLFLAGCGSYPWGVELDTPEQRTMRVPEIDASFQPIPLKVAVYIAPRAANALNYSDLRKLSGNPLLSYGTMGPALLEAVAEYFPKAFNEVSVINDFPDPALLLEELDAVIVFESGIGSRSNLKGGMGTGISQSLLNIGVYTPQGERLHRYRVIASDQPEFKFETNPYKAQELGYAEARVMNRAAVRLGLHRFPRGAVTTAQQRAAKDVDPATLVERRRVMHAEFDAAAPMIAGQPVDGMQQAAVQAGQIKTSSAAFGTQLAGMSGLNPGLAVLGQGMNQMIVSTSTRDPNAPASSTGTFLLEFLGGVSAAAQQKRVAINVARSSAGGGAPSSGTCQELARLAKECRARQASMGGGTTGQAGSFAQCAQMYSNAYNARCR